MLSVLANFAAEFLKSWISVEWALFASHYFKKIKGFTIMTNGSFIDFDR